MNIEDDILIERFLKNDLSKEEKEAVLARIDSEEDFKEKVLFEQELFETFNENDWSFTKNTNTPEIQEYEALFKSEEVIDIKKVIADVNTSHKKKSSKKGIIRFVYSAAASVAILVSAYVFMQPNNPTELYASYISKTKISSVITRGDNDSILSKGQTFFTSKEYDKVVKAFTPIVKNGSQNSSSYLYLAVSQMELNQFSEAENTLDNLINSDLLDAQKGYWYKSLLYLKSNQIEKSKSTLKIIVDNSYYNHKKATKLLKKISKL